MKITITKKLFAALLITFTAGTGAFAQEERTYTLNPNEITPSPEGYYIAGREINGTLHNGCGAGANENVTEHAASNHNESGANGGFTFEHVSVMPNCRGKGDPDFDAEYRGYIQVKEITGWAALVADFNNPENNFPHITSQPVTNVKSLSIQVGSDLSLGSRDVAFAILASEDNGATWDPYTVKILEQQGGRTYEFTAGGNDPGFNALATLSNSKTIRIRVMPWIGSRPSDVTSDRAHRLKVFSLSLTATGAPVTSLRSELANNEPFFEVKENSFVATNNKENLFVYNMIGALIGSGNNVTVPGKGLYIIRTDKGLSKKVFLQ